MSFEPFQQRREKFSDFYNAIALAHKIAPCEHSGHGHDHGITVAEIGVLLTDNPKLQDMVWVSGNGHSLDRMFPKDNFEKKIWEYLQFAKQHFTGKELEEIFIAIRDHGNKNSEEDSELTILLKDADRLGNTMLGIVIRSGQFTPDIPAMELQYLKTPNPVSTYPNPTSVIEDLRGCLEWEGWIRTPKAKVIAAPLFAELRHFMNTLASQYEMLGLAGVVL